jgi:hypothetical protein
MIYICVKSVTFETEELINLESYEIFVFRYYHNSLNFSGPKLGQFLDSYFLAL